jgi:predicted transposase YbfD/YdcC
MVNRIKVVAPTKEQMEYEEAKKDFRVATARARLHSVGIDPSKVSQQAMDKIMRIFDDMDRVQQDTQQRTSRLQQDAEMEIQRVNQEANKKFGEIQKKYQDLITFLREDKNEIAPGEGIRSEAGIQEKPEIQVEPSVEETKEEVREKTHEEKVAEIAEMLLHSMRGTVTEKVNEIMCKINEKASEINADVKKEELVKVD